MRGNLPLRFGRLVIQPIPHGDDHLLPVAETPLHILPDLDTGISCVQILQHVVVHTDHVHEREGVSVAVAVQRVRKGHLSLQLLLGSEMHQDLVFNTSRRIGGQTHVLIRFES